MNVWEEEKPQDNIIGLCRELDTRDGLVLCHQSGWMDEELV